MSGHTAGPWHRNIQPASKYPTVFAGRSTHVASVATVGISAREIEANCDLIAAAPALLANLTNLVGLAEMRPGKLHEYKAAIADARAAIAAALGTPSPADAG